MNFWLFSVNKLNNFAHLFILEQGLTHKIANLKLKELGPNKIQKLNLPNWAIASAVEFLNMHSLVLLFCSALSFTVF